MYYEAIKKRVVHVKHSNSVVYGIYIVDEKN